MVENPKRSAVVASVLIQAGLVSQSSHPDREISNFHRVNVPTVRIVRTVTRRGHSVGSPNHPLTRNFRFNRRFRLAFSTIWHPSARRSVRSDAAQRSAPLRGSVAKLGLWQLGPIRSDFASMNCFLLSPRALRMPDHLPVSSVLRPRHLFAHPSATPRREARNTTIGAISSGCANRPPSGVSETIC
jgi:hypothetical protein